MKLHFISGLPRSGSTLLAALLRQNPSFRAGMSSPLAQIAMKVQQATSRGSEGAVLVSDAQRKRLLRGLFANYYASNLGKVVFDTNRVWCAKMSLISELFPESKVICTVRDVSWVVNSIEKLMQGNPTELSGMIGFLPNMTVYGRVNMWAAHDGVVGYALNALREAYYGAYTDRLLLVDYEALARKPHDCMKFIYDFIGEPFYEHDFMNFEYQADDFDLSLGTPGLHTVKGPVAWRDEECLLPPDLFRQFANDAFWHDQTLNTKRVKVLLYKPNADDFVDDPMDDDYVLSLKRERRQKLRGAA